MSVNWLDFADDNDDLEEGFCASEGHYGMKPKATAATFHRVSGNSLSINRSCHFPSLQTNCDGRALISSFSAPQLETMPDVYSH